SLSLAAGASLTRGICTPVTSPLREFVKSSALPLLVGRAQLLNLLERRPILANQTRQALQPMLRMCRQDHRAQRLHQLFELAQTILRGGGLVSHSHHLF